VFPFREDKKPALGEISDEELVSRIVQTGWRAKQATKSALWMSELQMYSDEVKRRGKPHLWERAKVIFQATLQPFCYY